jgi:hypothetical protein
MNEKVVLPLDKRQLKKKKINLTRIHNRAIDTYCIHLIDILPAFVLFTLDPVPVQISEEAIDIVGSSSVSIPLPCIISQ